MYGIAHVLDKYFDCNTVKIIKSYYYDNCEITEEDYNKASNNNYNINNIILTAKVMCRKYNITFSKKIISMCIDLNVKKSKEYNWEIYDRNLDNTHFSLIDYKNECKLNGLSQGESYVICESYIKAKLIKNSLVYFMTLNWCDECPGCQTLKLENNSKEK